MTYSKKEVAKLIEKLLAYGLKNQMIGVEDIIYLRNQLMDLLDIPQPWGDRHIPLDHDIPGTATPILEKILDYAAEEGIIPDNSLVYRDLLDSKIMGIITPWPSQVIDRFNKIKESQGIKEATDYFYNLCQKSDYIRVNRIIKNKEWSFDSNYGTFKITINLTKPEKDPRDIAAEKKAPQIGYPQCALCPENVGYAGRVNHPARQNHRILPVELAGEKWYFQYSPYVYYNEHCIVLNEAHVPMKLNRKTFQRLFDFIESFPHYFIGSNADLPIVGGSILNHDHFQGGSYTFPMEKAPIEYNLTSKKYSKVKAGVLNWPMSTLRLVSHDSHVLVDLADQILDLWRDYSDPEVDILCQSLDKEGQVIPHNTITPIARKKENGLYELDLVFRNNRTSTQYPLGIFHPHPEIHHIKKENIGLIEVMGLFILPGRLQKELSQIIEFLTGKATLDREMLSSKDHPLHIHSRWIKDLLDKHGSHNNEEEAQTIIQNAVGQKCEQVLKDAGVFKCDEGGRHAFNKFLASAGFII